MYTYLGSRPPTSAGGYAQAHRELHQNVDASTVIQDHVVILAGDGILGAEEIPNCRMNPKGVESIRCDFCAKHTIGRSRIRHIIFGVCTETREGSKRFGAVPPMRESIPSDTPNL
jgi:hypothetical protein